MSASQKTTKIPASFISLLILAMIGLFCLYGCEKMPQNADTPDNPLDPQNPQKEYEGSALVISPTRINITPNSRFQVELWLVDSDSVAGASSRINFDPSILHAEKIDSLTKDSESILLQNGGKLIFFSEVNNDSGYIKIDCAVVEGTPRNVWGNGIISRIFLKHLAGNRTTITISDSCLKNSRNESIPIMTVKSCEINTK